MQKFAKTNDEWKQELTSEQYAVLRQRDTEYPGTGEYVDHFEDGTYVCAGCGNALFKSGNKYDAHCGWPSFDDVVSGEGVILQEDNSILMMPRIEVDCAQCGGHLGHVFNDGPKDTTGLRYCINSVALNFKPADETKA